MQPILCLLLVTLTAASAGMGECASVNCTTITAADALLIIDVQNDFLEARPVQPARKPAYPIPPSEIQNGSIVAGSLAVSNTTSMLPVIQSWIDVFSSAGGSVLASRDWHPAQHCSYCRNGTQASNPSGYLPHGGFCISGVDIPASVVNASNRCVDSVSVADYSHDQYHQWPDHCLQGSFGAELDPYLVTPAGITIVYKGFVLLNDSYSAFGGMDVPPNGRDLKTIIEQAGIQRLWVMGVATDFCVLQSTLDALGKNNNTGRPAPTTLQHVILVEPAARGVNPTSSAAAVATMSQAGAFIATALAPQDAVAQFCNAPGPAGAQQGATSEPEADPLAALL